MIKTAVFGGTTEGRLISQLLYDNSYDVELYVATELGEDIAREKGCCYKIHNGRLDKNAMEEEFSKEKYSLVIDATHPFAVEVTKNIKAVCRELQIRYIRLVREEKTFKDAVYIDNMEDLNDFEFNGNVLFTTGSKETAKFKGHKDDGFFIRVLPTEASLNSAKSQGFKEGAIIPGKGPFSLEDNINLIREKNIKYLITKDSGKTGGLEEKINACRICSISAVIIKRPKEEGIEFDEICDLIRRKEL